MPKMKVSCQIKSLKCPNLNKKDMFCLEHNFFDQKVDNLKAEFDQISVWKSNSTKFDNRI